MASKSFTTFLKILQDTKDLNESYNNYIKQKKEKDLGFITRSSCIMLCAAWERYNESLLLESIDIIIKTDIKAENIDKNIKKYLSEKVVNAKNKIEPIELADSGWKKLWKVYAENETELLNTPNSIKLKNIFKRFLGIEDYLSFWREGDSEKIDNFVKIRGEIAHKGNESKIIEWSYLQSITDTVIDLSIDIDHEMSLFLKSKFNVESTWEDNYFREIKSPRQRETK